MLLRRGNHRQEVSDITQARWAPWRGERVQGRCGKAWDQGHLRTVPVTRDEELSLGSEIIGQGVTVSSTESLLGRGVDTGKGSTNANITQVEFILDVVSVVTFHLFSSRAFIFLSGTELSIRTFASIPFSFSGARCGHWLELFIAFKICMRSALSDTSSAHLRAEQRVCQQSVFLNSWIPGDGD